MSIEEDLKTIANIATLSPAAGAGIGKILADALTIDAAKGGLRAERSFWVKSANGGHLESEPDQRVRVQTLFGLLAHMEGEPIKRIIHQHLGGSGSVDPLAALRESPELRAAAKRELEKAEWHDSGRKAYKVPKKVAEQSADSALEVG